MADYQRFVSYIYSYPGGVKDKNVGFAKVEIRAGEMHININLRGVYTDTPKMFGVHMLVDRDLAVPGKYRLIKAGDCIVNNGMSAYKGIFNAENIDNTGYSAAEICGIAIANENDSYYRMFSMWEDYAINPEAVEFARDKNEEAPADNNKKNTDIKVSNAEAEYIKEKLPETQDKEKDIEKSREECKEKEIRAMESGTDAGCPTLYEPMENEVNTKTKVPDSNTRLQYAENTDSDRLYKKLYSKADYIDAFEDDYFYDCIEVTPQMLLKLPIRDKEIINNSFLIHGYYNFHHLLFGRVCDNENNTNYFIGVPGMYCNREHYMASMFGFNNFKKSHRSDYSNPYFGYWYQEI